MDYRLVKKGTSQVQQLTLQDGYVKRRGRVKFNNRFTSASDDDVKIIQKLTDR